MDAPDLVSLRSHLDGVPFRKGASCGWWGVVDPHLGMPAWPCVLFWVAAAPRPSSPDRFCVRLDCTGYPHAAPTGTFWDVTSNQMLAPDKRPKGKEQVGIVFRTDWEGGRAFYHPLDRHALTTHLDWPQKYASMCWRPDRTIVDFLQMLYLFLNCADYTGV